MKKYFILFILLISLSCEQENAKPQVDILMNQTLFQNSENSVLNIDTMYVSHDHLTMNVQYAGCEQAESELISMDSFRESYPVQLAIKIKLTGMGSCEKLIHDQLIFDLSPIRQLYIEQYRQESGTILLDLENWPDFIRYEF